MTEEPGAKLKTHMRTKYTYLGVIIMLLITVSLAYAFATRSYKSIETNSLDTKTNLASIAGNKQSMDQAFSSNSNAASKDSRAKTPSQIQKITFSRGDYIYLFDPHTKRVDQIVKGSDPSLSPNGNLIAFTSDVKGARSPERTIKIFNLQTGQTGEFKSLAGSISCCSQWSADETKLAFRVIVGEQWHVGILNPDNGQWQILTKSLSDGVGVFLDSWVGNDSILCHDFNNLYEISLDSNILQKIPIERITAKSNISSNTRFSFSQDRRYLLFDSLPTPDENAAIFLFDFNRQLLSRITPETIDGSEPKWLPSGDIIFAHSVESNDGKIFFDVSKISIDGSNIETLIRKASQASYSAQ